MEFNTRNDKPLQSEQRANTSVQLGGVRPVGWCKKETTRSLDGPMSSRSAAPALLWEAERWRQDVLTGTLPVKYQKSSGLVFSGFFLGGRGGYSDLTRLWLSYLPRMRAQKGPESGDKDNSGEGRALSQRAQRMRPARLRLKQRPRLPSAGSNNAPPRPGAVAQRGCYGSGAGPPPV